MKQILLTTALVAGFLSPALAADKVFSDSQEKQIENIVQTYLQDNPKVVMQALEAAMAQQQMEELQKLQQAVVQNKDKLYSDSRSPIVGNPKGSDELVVFMDPYCGFCKKFHTELDKALKANANLKVVFKDIAIMGKGSNIAVRAMLAANKQGKYIQLQDKILKSDKRLTKKQILKEAETLGLNAKQLEKDMDSDDVKKLAEDTMRLASDLGVNGTPTLIIGETVHPGYVPAEELNRMFKQPTQPNS